MKYLITGARGFVGSLLCAELVRQGQTVRAAMRTVQSPVNNAEGVGVGQIDGGTVWADALHGVDVIVHLAARVHVMQETAVDPLAEFLRVNLHGTVNLARQAVQAQVKRLVYVSSIGVNGNRTDGAQAFLESDTPHPHNAYAVSKWQAEQALREIALETRLGIVVVRPPLVYGPTAKGNFQKLLAAINKGLPLPLAGANNARSLVYVGNLVDALIVCATHPAAAGQTYLVRDGEDVSTALLVEKIAATLGRKSRTFYIPPGLLRVAAAVLGRSDQLDSLFGSLRVSDAKIRRELGWVPPYTLEQGLRATAAWYFAHAPE
ncbi:MAG: SDR family oxidoreductase [Gallionella sp.]